MGYVNLRLVALFISSLSFTCILAQKNTVATGGKAAGSGGTLNYSVGQIDFREQSGANGSVNQGLQQPYEFYTVGVDFNEEISLKMLLYPNPTESDVELKIENENVGKLTYHLFDLEGKLLSYENINSAVTSIPMENLPSAIYYLKISQNKQTIKTFKIVKNR